MRTLMLFVLLAILAGSPTQARQLGGLDTLLAFECQILSAAGRTVLHYDSQSKNRIVTGLRNGLVKVTYNLESAGSYWVPMSSRKASQISLSGGPLARSQYLTLAFNEILPSGVNSASGSVLFSTVGGSVFAPVPMGVTPVGSVYCPRIVVQ
ncbi:MAG: hypothetical protein ACK5Y2_07625 [Bdellovibrionales bacterium]